MTYELTIVIPAYDEAAALMRGLDVIAEHARTATADFEVLVVDDGSRDSTWEIVCQASARVPEVRGVRLSRNFGKEAAVFAGLAEARGAAVLVMDADLQHPAEAIPLLFHAWQYGDADVVDGVKRQRQFESWHRRAVSDVFNRTITALTGHDFRGTSDFKLLDRGVVNAILAMPEHRTFFRGMVDWAGFRHQAIAYDVARRGEGRSKWGFWSLVRLAGRAVISFSAVPLRLIHVAALTFLLAACALAVRALWLYWTGSALAGFTTVILVLLAVGALVLLALGVIAEYVAAIYEEVKRRPRYLISERCPARSERHAD
jgi:polyisoprenyl-phosphate glycosyltransferase